MLLFYLFCAKKIKLSGHWRTLGKCRNYLPAARVFYISLAFSNARRVLSQCNTRLRLFHLLNKQSRQQSGRALCVCALPRGTSIGGRDGTKTSVVEFAIEM